MQVLIIYLQKLFGGIQQLGSDFNNRYVVYNYGELNKYLWVIGIQVLIVILLEQLGLIL
jgi:hypothetical protein